MEISIKVIIVPIGKMDWVSSNGLMAISIKDSSVRI